MKLPKLHLYNLPITIILLILIVFLIYMFNNYYMHNINTISKLNTENFDDKIKINDKIDAKLDAKLDSKLKHNILTNDEIFKLTKNECELVISRYNEDISWSLPYSHLRTVYNKGADDLGNEYNPIIKLPNIGTEINTILEHIIRNYDNLANNTIFLQGNISDRNCQDTIKLETFFHSRNDDIIGCKQKIDVHYIWKHPSEYNTRKLDPSPYSLGEFFEVILGINFSSDIDIIYQSNFAVGKTNIKKRTKQYYIDILNNTTLSKSRFPEEGHFMERAWYSIFS